MTKILGLLLVSGHLLNKVGHSLIAMIQSQELELVITYN